MCVYTQHTNPFTHVHVCISWDTHKSKGVVYPVQWCKEMFTSHKEQFVLCSPKDTSVSVISNIAVVVFFSASET